MADKKEQQKMEMDLFHAFRKSPSKDTFHPLYESFKPLIFSAAKTNMYKSPIPRSAHTALAAQSFLDAVKSFDPKKGSLRTHVYGAVQNKGKRLNYKYQNIGFIPEERATKYGLFRSTVEMLRGMHGRDPSTLEIADEIKWSPKQVETMRREMRGSLILGEEVAERSPFYQSDRGRQILQDIQYSLIPHHQTVLEHAAGLNGRTALTKPGEKGPDISAISRAARLTPSQVRSALKTITRKVRQYRSGNSFNGHLEEDGDVSVF